MLDAEIDVGGGNPSLLEGLTLEGTLRVHVVLMEDVAQVQGWREECEQGEGVFLLVFAGKQGVDFFGVEPHGPAHFQQSLSNQLGWEHVMVRVDNRPDCGLDAIGLHTKNST